MSDEHTTAETTTAVQLDEEKARAFAKRAFKDLAATYTTALCLLGDRLGLFKDLAANGAATSAELAVRTQLDERYLREWLGGLACAGYLAHDPKTNRFALPAEHAPVLAHETDLSSLGPEYHQLQGLLGVFDPLLAAFRQGGGVPQSAYHESFWDGLERSSLIYCRNLLLQQWIPAMTGVEQRLREGITVADIGCGRGRALITLAEAFPQSRFVGYDIFAPTIARASANAAAAGVADRVRFAALDAAQGLPESYDLICTFDVLHDSADPAALLRTIHAGLRPGGAYLCLEPHADETIEELAGPHGTYLFGASVLYCMTTSLAQGGAGLGTAGLPEARLRELCAGAGFTSLRRLPLDDPFRAVFEARP